MRRAVAGFDERRCVGAMQQLKSGGAWQIPTLIRLKAIYLASDPAFASDPHLRYMDHDTMRAGACRRVGCGA